MQPKRIFGMCNPLLDMTVQIETRELLDKYNLKESDAILVHEPHPLFNDMLNHKIIKTAGGSALNTMRVISWVLQGTGDVNFLGCVGNDDFGRELTKVANEAKVKTHFMVTNDHQTGCCASVIYKKDRSLVAHVSAAEHYSVDHFASTEIQSVVQGAEFFYVSGFFILSSLPTCLALGQYCAQNDKVLMMNLSAPFIIEFFWDNFFSFFQYADYVVGNEHETLAFAKKNGWETEDFHVIAEKISKMPKINNNRKRTVIITQGSKETLVYQEGIQVFGVPKIDKDLIVDTNGAGDSFVGGVLAGFSLGKPLAKCIDAGHYCAGFVIQRTGCDLDSESKYGWNDEPRVVLKEE
jgi:adenosine kinase